MKRIKSDKIILKDKIISGYIYFEDNTIFDVSDKEMDFDTEYDYTGKYVSAGFIDMHTHGGGGFSFDGDAEEVINAADFHLSHGTRHPRKIDRAEHGTLFWHRPHGRCHPPLESDAGGARYFGRCCRRRRGQRR